MNKNLKKWIAVAGAAIAGAATYHVLSKLKRPALDAGTVQETVDHNPVTPKEYAEERKQRAEAAREAMKTPEAENSTTD